MFFFSVCRPLPSASGGACMSPGSAGGGRVPGLEIRAEEDSSPSGGLVGVPRYESHWMSAELLSISVDFIDTLLEDWYPGLGAREGGKTMDSIPYVNRIIPCPYCVNAATLLEEDTQVGGGRGVAYSLMGLTLPSPALYSHEAIWCALIEYIHILLVSCSHVENVHGRLRFMQVLPLGFAIGADEVPFLCQLWLPQPESRKPRPLLLQERLQDTETEEASLLEYVHLFLQLLPLHQLQSQARAVPGQPRGQTQAEGAEHLYRRRHAHHSTLQGGGRGRGGGDGWWREDHQEAGKPARTTGQARCALNRIHTARHIRILACACAGQASYAVVAGQSSLASCT